MRIRIKRMIKQNARFVNNAIGFGRIEDGRLEVLSYSNLKDYDDAIVRAVEGGIMDAPQELFEVAERDALFFYTATQFKVDEGRHINKKVAIEDGLGKICKRYGRFFLERDTVHSLHEPSYDGNYHRTRHHGGTPYDFKNEDYIVIYAHPPTSYVDALFLPHSVLCSIEEQTPTPVELQENSVLGRVDGRIQALGREEILGLLGIYIENGMVKAC